MDKDLLSDVYKFDEIYPDPYEVIRKFRSAPDSEKIELIKTIKESGLRGNQNIRREIKKFESSGNM